MNKKLFAAVFGTLLLCSCGNGGTEEVPETTAENVAVASAASETTVTTTAAETASEAVSEVSETEKKAPITRDFFNDDVVFEEVLLPVKATYYKNGTLNGAFTKEYDAAGNIICENIHTTYEYDYTPDGTYNSVSTFKDGKLSEIKKYDKNRYCIEITSVGNNSEFTNEYEYEFDDEGRLIRKSEIYDGEKEGFEYTYDEEGRLYEEFDNVTYRSYCHLRHEYDGNIENIYYSRYDLEEGLWEILEKDENGNTIKETSDFGFISNNDYVKGKLFTEYKYDSLNRLIYENHTVSDDFIAPDDYFNLSKQSTLIYSYTYEYEGDKLKKETACNVYRDDKSEYWENNETTEYFYDGNGRIVKEVYTYDLEYDPHNEYPIGYTTEYSYNEDGTIISHTHNMNGDLTNETEYAMIPKIKTGIEYKYFDQVEP